LRKFPAWTFFVVMASFVCVAIIARTGSTDSESPPGTELTAHFTPPAVSALPDDQAPAETEEHIEYTEEYIVYTEGNDSRSVYKTFDEALLAAEQLERSSIKKSGKSGVLWDNLPDFSVFDGDGEAVEFDGFAEAYVYAQESGMRYVFSLDKHKVVWTSKRAMIDDVPLIAQNPELPYGCEVTSLAMMLRYAGVDTDKMTLAAQIKKNNTPVYNIRGGLHAGDPNDGFVGAMFTEGAFGYGVYHSPVFELAESYLPGRAVDITGEGFSAVLDFLDSGSPVWVIVNTRFAPLPPQSFVRWETPNGEISVTYSEHSVLITGYDADNIYFNDPLMIAGHAPRGAFVSAWEQMGGQAVTYRQP
jgi:uncharacterized protein YvpB